ncbi:gap junction delta-2 protein-like [Petromyzon marinus]|uniref:gap junction delta-2 protein-like n=1 Tax=Petromyzon marinus TaxID=7757 RepID=UPI003F705CEF
MWTGSNTRAMLTGPDNSQSALPNKSLSIAVLWTRQATGDPAVMTEWAVFKRLLDAVYQHSTLLGQVWLTVTLIFRLLIVAVASESVYEDEQAQFACNTLQPGCPTVCYDRFAPISHPRFWIFQIIIVSSPSLCFLIYVWHMLSKGGTVGDGRKGICPISEDASNKDQADISKYKPYTGGPYKSDEQLLFLYNEQDTFRDLNAEPCTTKWGKMGQPRNRIWNCYVLHVCCRTILEVAFVLGQWLLFGFRVPIHYKCQVFPCPLIVDCFVSRPTEKKIFLLFMFSVGVFCICLNIVELNHLGWKKIKSLITKRNNLHVQIEETTNPISVAEDSCCQVSTHHNLQDNKSHLQTKSSSSSSTSAAYDVHAQEHLRPHFNFAQKITLDKRFQEQTLYRMGEESGEISPKKVSRKNIDLWV